MGVTGAHGGQEQLSSCPGHLEQFPLVSGTDERHFNESLKREAIKSKKSQASWRFESQSQLKYQNP